MPWWTLLSLLVLAAVLVVGVVVAAVLVLRTLRALGRVEGSMTAASAGLLVRMDRMRELLDGVEERRARVDHHLAAVAESQRRLSVLTWALADTQSFVARARGAVPRK